MIVAPITTKRKKCYLPTHVTLQEMMDLPRRSMVLLEQLRVLDKQRLREYVAHVSDGDMEEIDEALSASLALPYRP